MKRKKIMAAAVYILVAVILNIVILNYRTDFEGDSKNIYVTVESEKDVEVRLYYSEDGTWKEKPDQTGYYSAEISQGVGTLSFSLPLNYEDYRIRCSEPDGTGVISDIYYQYYFIKGSLLEKCSVEADAEDTADYMITGEVIRNSLNETQRGFQFKVDLLFCVILDVAILILAKYMRNILRLGKEIIQNRKMVLSLGKNDFKTRFAGSYLGIIWAFIQPVVTILVYWFVFQVGLKSTPVNNFPFVLWLTAGLVPWFFFSEAWMAGTGSLTEYSYLVKKVVFNISTIPVVKIISALFVHVFFVTFMLVLYICYGYFPNPYWIQIIYYSFCMIALVTALSYLSCSIMVFFRDLSQIINIILQVGIWLTGIMWSADMLPERFRWLMYFNPMYYVVDGYRRALVSGGWFWQVPYQTLGFWIFVIVLMCIGVNIFNKLRVHFADVL